MTRPRTAGVEGRRRRVTHIGVADLLIALLLAGCGVASTPTTTPTSAPMTSPMSAATASPTPALDPSHTPTATAVSTGVGWLAYAGSGFRISYPPEWKVQAKQDGTGLQLVSPSTYPFLVVLNRGPVNPATPQVLAEASLIDVRENLGSKDATDSPTVLGGDDAVLIRYHHTSADSGIKYYSLKVTGVHDGTWYEAVLTSKEGQEAEADALLTQFLDSFTFQGAAETAVGKLACATPEGWALTPLPNGIARYGPNHKGVFFDGGPRGQDTLASWSAKTVTALETMGQITIVSNVASTVGGADGRRLTLTINSDGGPIFGIAEGFFHGDLGYDLLWMSPVGSETADTATFQQIVDSCKFIE